MESAKEAPPFVIGKPVSVAGEREGYYKYAGVEFTCHNKNTKTMSVISVSFMVYDAETSKTPFIGSNIIKADFEGELAGDEEKLFIISLDTYIYTAPDKPYLIDFFYISRVEFVDGSVWEDPYGAYHTRSY
jgi:hypothetical protein